MLRTLAAPALLMAAAACTSAVQPGSPEFVQDDNAHSFVVAANMGEIEEGQLALQRSSADAVRGLAQQIVDDHSRSLAAHMQMGHVFGTTTANVGTPSPAPPADLMARVDRNGLTASSWAADMMRNHEQSMTGLQARTGTDFDRAFIERQIAVHRHVLSTIDALLPSVTTPELRMQLQNDRAAVAAHLAAAERLRQ